MKAGNINFLESSGPVQACNGTALPSPVDLFRIIHHVGGEGVFTK